jgi:hypothetical protein
MIARQVLLSHMPGPVCFSLLWIQSRVLSGAQTEIFLHMPSVYLGLQTCTTTLGLFVAMESYNFLFRLTSNFDPPDFCLLHSLDYRC